MTTFVRKNVLRCKGYVRALDGVSVPSTGIVTLVYTNVSGSQQMDQVSLSLQADGTWQGTWDSTPAGDTPVQWAVKWDGGLKAADQGEFYIAANAANILSGG